LRDARETGRDGKFADAVVPVTYTAAALSTASALGESSSLPPR
jgi:hypothetical protein